MAPRFFVWRDVRQALRLGKAIMLMRKGFIEAGCAKRH
jgi:ABC-type proline/glycine betaine transport system ATPase subunit